jgi:hypothetical protein
MDRIKLILFSTLSSNSLHLCSCRRVTSLNIKQRCYLCIIYIIIIIIKITMARQPYMGLGLLFPRLQGLCAFAAVRDRLTGRVFQLDPDVTARAIWQSVRRLGWEMAAWILDYGHYWFFFMPEGSFTCRKSTTWDRRLYFPSEGSCATDFYHP